MKFEEKYPDAEKTDQFEFEYSFVTKDAKLGFCSVCGDMTRWVDTRLEKHICSEECGGKAWKQASESNPEKVQENEEKAKEELSAAAKCEDAFKDIIMIVRDQLEYVKIAVESIRMFTKNYKLWIWDNDSGQETKQYLQELLIEYNEACQSGDIDWEIEVWHADSNKGFIGPNNSIAEATTGDYIIPINSDTKVFEHWDTAMIAHLKNNPNVRQVGYWGGHLDSDGRGFGGDNGYNVDYIPGWCFAISRETYDEFGLFNKQLRFAYCEDADLSLRLKEAGHQIYALHIPLVHHFQNKTIKTVRKEGEVDVEATFEYNHKYIKQRWSDYLKNGRVLIKEGLK